MPYRLRPFQVPGVALEHRLIVPPMAPAHAEAAGKVHSTLLDHYAGPENPISAREETMKIRGRHKTREVFIDGVLLDPVDSQKIYNHSPDGFSWGAPDSGCSQLALALVLRFAGSARIANRLYHDFKVEIVQHIPTDSDFELDAELITDWIAERRLKLEQAGNI